MRLMVEETKKGGAGEPASEVEALLGGLRFVEEASVFHGGSMAKHLGRRAGAVEEAPVSAAPAR